MKAYTNLEQSKKLAEILPLESADMILPFTHTEDGKYIPGYVISRKYVEVYNEMIKLIGMDKEEVHKLIQPTWSLAALISVLPEGIIENYYAPNLQKENGKYSIAYGNEEFLCTADNPVDACVEMIIKLHEQKLL